MTTQGSRRDAGAPRQGEALQGEALRAKYRERARQAAPARRGRPVRRAHRAVRRPPRGPLHRGRRPRARCATRSPWRSSAAVSPGCAPAPGLTQAGIDDVRIIDGGGDVGGVWYWNRYPGAMCDTAAMVYLPLLEETGHSAVDEVRPRPRDPRARPADRHHLRPLRQRPVLDRGHRAVDWDGDAIRWVIRTDRGDEFRARFVAMGTGPIHRPKLPGIPGIESFEGPLLPHQPLGLRLHRGRPGRGAHGEPGRQAGGHHRHRAPPPCSASPTWPATPRSCSSSSARRRRSTCATTTPSTRTSSRRWSPAGNGSG